MPVSNPASFKSVQQEFPGGGNSFKAHVRGSAAVPINSPSQISTTEAGLKLSQFNGVSKPSTALSAYADPNYVSSFEPEGSSFAQGATTVYASGGTGSYTYSWQRISGFGQNAVGPTTERTLIVQSSSGYTSCTWRCTVTSGGSSVTVDVMFDLSIGQPM